MPQPKTFVADDSIPESFVPDDADKPGILSQIGHSLSSALDTTKQELEKHPNIKKYAERFLTGTDPETEQLMKDKGITRVLGTPESEKSFLPEIKPPVNPDSESWGHYLARGGYNLLVRPLGTPSGFVGAAQPGDTKAPALEISGTRRTNPNINPDALNSTGLTAEQQAASLPIKKTSGTIKSSSIADELTNIKKSNAAASEVKPEVDTAFEEAKQILAEDRRAKTIAKAQKVVESKKPSAPQSETGSVPQSISPEADAATTKFLQGDGKQFTLPLESSQVPWDLRNSAQTADELPIRDPNIRAKFLGFQENPGEASIPLYNIEGGESHGSTVSADTLRAKGIDVPETPPAEAAPQNNAENVAAKQAAIDKIKANRANKPFVNPFAKSVESSQPVTTGLSAASEELPIKKTLTIDNAPPNQRARMFRGAHDPVDVLFTDSNSREAFGAGALPKMDGLDHSAQLERLAQRSKQIASKYNVDEQTARGLLLDYNKEIKNLGKQQSKAGENLNFTAPTFDDFVNEKLKSDIPGYTTEVPASETPNSFQPDEDTALKDMFKGEVPVKQQNIQNAEDASFGRADADYSGGMDNAVQEVKNLDPNNIKTIIETNNRKEAAKIRSLLEAMPVSELDKPENTKLYNTMSDIADGLTKNGDVAAKPRIPQNLAENTGLESKPPRLAGLTNHGDGLLYIEFDRSNPVTVENVQSMFPDKKLRITELHEGTEPANIQRFRVDALDETGEPSQTIGDQIEDQIGGSFKEHDSPNKPPGIVEMQGGLGALKVGGKGGGSSRMPPRPGLIGSAVDKLVDSLQASKGLRTKQEAIYKSELARKFAASAGAKGEGVDWASNTLSAMKGDLTKINRSALELSDEQTKALFDGIKKANITQPEKIKAVSAMFKILNGGEVPQRSEIQLLGDVFGGDFANQIMELHGGLGAVRINLAKTFSTMKSMSSALDLSALRSGIGLVYRPEYWSAAKDYIKYMTNPEYFKAAMDSIESDPMYLLSKEGGLFTAKTGSLTKGEEMFSQSYVHNIPGVKQIVDFSDRGYTGFLNKLRFDTFKNMVEQAHGLGHKMYDIIEEGGVKTVTPTKETRAISRYINNMTGRGSLDLSGKGGDSIWNLEKMAPELGEILWAPRQLSAKMTLMTNPKIYTDLPKGMRLEGLKSLLALGALGLGMNALGKAAGGKLNYDILSTDFGKVRFGNKVVDPWFGYQQPVVAAARFLSGKTDKGDQSRLKTLGNFAASKESPGASLAHTLLTAKEFTGKGNFIDQYNNQTSIQKEAALKFAPMLTQDLYDLVTTHPTFSEAVGLNSALAAAATTGVGVQDYPERQQNRLQMRGFNKMTP